MDVVQQASRIVNQEFEQDRLTVVAGPDERALGPLRASLGADPVLTVVMCSLCEQLGTPAPATRLTFVLRKTMENINYVWLEMTCQAGHEIVARFNDGSGAVASQISAQVPPPWRRP